MKAFTKPSKDDVKVIRAICKKHGVKRVKMMQCQTGGVIVGSQVDGIESSTAVALMNDLNKVGFDEIYRDSFEALVSLNLVSQFQVHKVA